MIRKCLFGNVSCALQHKYNLPFSYMPVYHTRNFSLILPSTVTAMMDSFDKSYCSELDLKETLQSFQKVLKDDRLIRRLLLRYQSRSKGANMKKGTKLAAEEHGISHRELSQIVDGLMINCSYNAVSWQLPEEKALNHLLVMLCKSNDLERAWELRQLIHDRRAKLNITCANLLIHLLLKNGKCNEALEVFYFINVQERDILTYSLILIGLSFNGRARQALKIFGEYREYTSKLPSTVLKSFLSPLVQKGYFDDLNRTVFNTAGTAALVPWNIILCNALMRAFVENNKLWRASELFEMIIEDNSNIEPNLETYEILIAAFLAKNYVNHARQLLDNLLNNKSENQLRSTLSLLTHFFNHFSENNVKELYKLFMELKSKYNLQPDVNIYCIMLKAYKRIGAIDKVTAIIEEMKTNGIITSASLILEKVTSFIMKKQPNDAEEYLEKNWKELQINAFERMHLLYSVLQAYLDKGALKSRIENLINRMEKDFNIRPNTKCYNILMSACSRDNAPMENTIQLLSKFNPDVETFFILISACQKQNNMEEAWKILEMMRTQYNINPSYDIYNIFISYYCSIDGAYNMEKASQLFNMMLTDKNSRPTRTILEQMIRGYLMKNMEKEAEEMYEMHQKKGLIPSYHTVKSFVNYYTKIKTIEGVTKLRKWKKQLRDNYP